MCHFQKHKLRHSIAVKILLLVFLSVPIESRASCIESIENRIHAKQEKLVHARTREKKILKITAVSTFTPTALVMGTMAKLIIDGGTIGTAIIVGSSFGAFVGAGAVAAVAVPMVTYNQILKAEIRGMSRTLELLKASSSQDLENPLLTRLIRRLQKKRPDWTASKILDALNLANQENALCHPESKIPGLRKIETYLLNHSTLLEEGASLILLD
jgi:uncharacterized membrane protein required for colicin V production